MDGTILFSRYKIISTIGKGSFSTVYKAIDLNQADQRNPDNPHRFVAIKKVNLHDHKENSLQNHRIFDLKGKSTNQRDLIKSKAVVNFIENASNIERKQLLREIEITKNVHHPNIVECYDVVTENGQAQIDPNSPKFYLIMEYMPNGSLLEYLQQSGKCLDETKACHFFKQMVAAVSYLHSHKIMHRDIKFENFMVVNDNLIKLIDFGLSIQLENEQDIESTKTDYFNGTFCGSLSYSAPEIIAQNRYSYSGDIWSLGIVLFGMIFGRFPFQGNGDVIINEILTQQLFFPKPVSNELENLLLEILRKNPKNRLTIEEVKNHQWLQIDHHDVPNHQTPNSGSISMANSSVTIHQESPPTNDCSINSPFSKNKLLHNLSQKQIPEIMTESPTNISPLDEVSQPPLSNQQDFFSNFRVGLNAFAQEQRLVPSNNPFLNNEFLSMKQSSGIIVLKNGQNENKISPRMPSNNLNESDQLPALHEFPSINANTTSNLKGPKKLIAPRQKLRAQPRHKSIQIDKAEALRLKKIIQKNPFI